MLPTNFECHHHYAISIIDVNLISKQENSIDVPPIIADSYSSDLPLLNIHFNFYIQDQYWYTQPNDLESVLMHSTWEGSTNSFHINFHPSDIMLYQRLKRAISAVFVHLKDKFGDECHPIIEHTTHQLQRILTIETPGACVDVTFVIDHVCDGRILFASQELSMDGMVPASKSSIELLEPMDVDERNINDECMVCLEEMGEETIVLSFPCSHMFHGDCITKWLEKSHYCPLCRFQMPTD